MILGSDKMRDRDIRNPALLNYLAIYRQIESDFLDRISGFGLGLAPKESSPPNGEWAERLESMGTIFGNNGKSIHTGEISPACVACRKGVGSVTYFLSLQCNRSCYFCFNPNQEGYAYFQQNKRDGLRELDQLRDSEKQIDHIALTGGEPLLHTRETIEFFRHAKQLFPEVYTRLYTSGDFADEATLRELEACELDEIRFSIRLHDRELQREENFGRMQRAKEHIPAVMVEMPVLPKSFEPMKSILLRLEDIGISSINLLEFCFPFHNAKTFRAKGYTIKNPPYRIPYDYWYAGGLPIAGSEAECLRLVEFAAQREFKMSVHYCSLENKHTGQIYQQNYGKPVPERYHFSEKDFLLKSAKVFGEDMGKVLPTLNATGEAGYFLDTEHEYLEFHVDHIARLDHADLDIGISSSIIETRGNEDVIRELQIGLTTPALFDANVDL